MPFDGSGNFTRAFNWVTDKTNGIKVIASRMDGEFDNFSTGMNQVLLRNGVASLTGNLNMGTNGIIALGDGSAGTPIVRFNSDVTSGLYTPGFGKVALSAGGVERIEGNSTGVNLIGTTAMTGSFTVSANGTVTGTLGVTGLTSLTTSAHSGIANFSAEVGIKGAPVASTNSPLQVTGDELLANSTLVTLGFNTYFASAAWKQAVTGFAGSISSDPTTGVMTFNTSPGSVAAAASNSIAERMRINAAGNVGIGATSLAARLHVVGTVSIGSQPNVAAVFGQNSTSDLLVGSIGGTVPFIGSQGANPLAIYTNAGEKVRVTSAGDVGIGATSPVNTASYTGLTINGTTGGIISFGAAAAEKARITGTAAELQMNAIGAIPLTFYTTNAEHMRLDASGNLGIMTNNPQAPLHVFGASARVDSSASQPRFDLWNGATQYGGIGSSGWVLGSTASDVALNATSTRSVVFFTNGSTTERARVDTNGNFGVGTPSPVNNANYGGITVNGSSGGVISGMVGGVEKSRITTDTAMTVGTVAAIPTWIQSNSVVRLIVLSSGEVHLNQAQAPTQVYDVGYLGIPQVGGAIKVGSYTAVLADAGQHIAFNAAALTATIPANASVAYPVGTTLTFINTNAAVLNIAITSDTMTMANTVLTGARTLGQNGLATAVKITSTSWLISGVGLA